MKLKPKVPDNEKLSRYRIHYFLIFDLAAACQTAF
jgi:hypothetical protein